MAPCAFTVTVRVSSETGLCRFPQPEPSQKLLLSHADCGVERSDRHCLKGETAHEAKAITVGREFSSYYWELSPLQHKP